MSLKKIPRWPLAVVSPPHHLLGTRTVLIVFRLSVMVSRLRVYLYLSSCKSIIGKVNLTSLTASIINSILFSLVLLFHVRAHVHKVSACCNAFALCLETRV
ncbi:hypothetical protein K438DRAFT_1843163, partial [Mycena galopus ATCC 62051]